MNYEDLGLNESLRPVNSPIERLASSRSGLDPILVDYLYERGTIRGNSILGSSLTNAEVRNAYRAYNVVVSATVGDGDTNDIQEAINNLNFLGEGGVILIRPGTYLPVSPLTLYSNISLVGVDPVNTIIDLTNAGNLTNGGVQIRGTLVTSDGTIAVTNGAATVTGNSTQFSTDSVAAGDSIMIWGVKYTVSSVTSDTELTLTETYRGDTASNISYDIFDSVKNVDIRNMTIKDGSTAGTAGEGINIFYSENIVIQNCIITNNNDGIDIDNSFEVVIDGNVIKSNTGAGITVNDAFSSNIKNNICSNNTVSGIASNFTDLGSNFFIVDNVCNSNGSYGIYLNVASNQLLRGNSCNSNNTHGIYLEGSSYNIITSNRCTYNGVDGLHLTNKVAVNSEFNSISSNHISYNTDDGIELTAGTNANVSANNILESNSGTAYVDAGTSNIDDNNI